METFKRKRVGQTAVSDNQSSSVTLNELARKPEKDIVISNFSEEVIQLRNRFVLAVICCLIYHCLDVSR